MVLALLLAFGLILGLGMVLIVAWSFVLCLRRLVAGGMGKSEVRVARLLVFKQA